MNVAISIVYAVLIFFMMFIISALSKKYANMTYNIFLETILNSISVVLDIICISIVILAVGTIIVVFVKMIFDALMINEYLMF